MMASFSFSSLNPNQDDPLRMPILPAIPHMTVASAASLIQRQGRLQANGFRWRSVLPSIRRLFCTGLLLAFAVTSESKAEDQGVTFYVQIIRGTNEDKPNDAMWEVVEPKLTKKLSPIFKWKHYWEMKRQAVSVTKGKVTRVAATGEREVEIELVKENQIELRLYRKRELRRKMKASVETTMTILAGDAPENEGWFIVVRRDKPSSE